MDRTLAGLAKRLSSPLHRLHDNVQCLSFVDLRPEGSERNNQRLRSKRNWNEARRLDCLLTGPL